MTYTVEIESDLPFRPGDVAAVVTATLTHRQGWTSLGEGGFRHVRADPDVRVLLATPRTVDHLCAPLETRGEVSCRNGDMAVLNAERWVRGIPEYAGRLADYRRYMINHEVGHFLGYWHVTCPGRGRPAPVMQQQTYGLHGCLPNPWPRPGQHAGST